MPIRFRCAECQQGISIHERMAGREILCRTCGGIIRVPGRPRAATARDPEDYFEDDLTPSPPPPPRRAPRRAQDRSNFSLSSALLPCALGLMGVVGVGLGLWFAFWLFSSAETPTTVQSRGAGVDGLGGDVVNPDSPFVLSSIPVPSFPDLSPPKTLFPSHVNVHVVDCALNNAAQEGPGLHMKMRVYLPPGDHQPRSLGCVLVPPAGTNLLCGSHINLGEYHDETLPYALAGFAVINYSLDGAVDDLENASDQQLQTAYERFKAAHAGLVNARNALEFALRKLPQVDPKRIFSAGHSSAGTLSLLFAEHESRLRGCIAYAPVTDVEAHLAKVVATPGVDQLFRGVADFALRSSPKAHYASLRAPVFLFHALDDSVAPHSSSAEFSMLCKSRQLDCKLSVTNHGGHYQSMIDDGIPRGIEWMQDILKRSPSQFTPAPVEPPQVAEAPPRAPQFLPIDPARPGGLPGIPRPPAIPPFGGVRPGVRRPVGGGMVGYRVTFQVLAWNGQGDPGQAARQALQNIPWAIADQTTYEEAAKKIVVPVQGSSISTAGAKASLQGAGFVIGFTQVSR